MENAALGTSCPPDNQQEAKIFHNFAPVTSNEVRKVLASIPAKLSPLDFVPT